MKKILKSFKNIKGVEFSASAPISKKEEYIGYSLALISIVSFVFVLLGKCLYVTIPLTLLFLVYLSVLLYIHIIKGNKKQVHVDKYNIKTSYDTIKDEAKTDVLEYEEINK